MSNSQNKQLVYQAIKIIKDYMIESKQLNNTDKLWYMENELYNILNLLNKIDFEDNKSDNKSDNKFDNESNNHLFDFMVENTNDSSLTLDYGKGCISYDDLALSLKDKQSNRFWNNHIISVSSVINDLEMNKNYNKIQLNNNIISDEGLNHLVKYLKNYNNLQILDVSDNLISDIGLQCLVELLDLPNLKKIIIKDNYGPSQETLSILRNDKRIIY
jgi:Ran GTPase-activating protein (RanGAP) involved in mRNA processing and transport